MKRTILLTVALMLASGAAMAAVDLSFEAADTNTLGEPDFSGSTMGIGKGTAADTVYSDTTDFNGTLNPIDGTAGVACYKTTFNLTTDAPATSFLRITDANSTRHLLSAPAASGGIGAYVKYDGAAGNIEVAVSIREEPVSTGANEVYETTKWKVLSGSPNWQYLYWSFTADIVSDPVNSWAQANGLGDGTYDGGTGAPTFEAFHVRPITGVTTVATDIVLKLDDIHTGVQHTPIVPTAVNNWALYN